MTDLFSAISGHFTKSVVFGILLPVILFLALALSFVPPDPATSPFAEILSAKDGWRIVVFSLLALALSALLLIVNIPILRFYEGYTWRDSWIGRRRTKYYQNQLEDARAKVAGLLWLISDMRKLDKKDRRIDELKVRRRRLAYLVTNQFPKTLASVLPTRLGNVIRSFESYPTQQYGMSSILLWPRLTAKVDKDYMASVENAKSSFDFMMNTSLLSAALAVAVLTSGLLTPSRTATLLSAGAWIAETGAFALLSYLAYLGSIGRAAAWGAQVKGAFDLYRWDLLEQLGYDDVPQTKAEERKLWDNISRQMIYGDQPNGRPLPYRSAVNFVDAQPVSLNLEVSRGVIGRAANGTVMVVITVKNPAAKTTATKVSVTDTLPEGFDYVWGSAKATAGSPRVTGVNPYKFALPDLQPSSELILTYSLLPRSKDSVAIFPKQD
jgi:uncharacterized repeat protein (TIGR01451 family)